MLDAGDNIGKNKAMSMENCGGGQKRPSNPGGTGGIKARNGNERDLLFGKQEV